jgi:hypothetical protein
LNSIDGYGCSNMQWQLLHPKAHDMSVLPSDHSTTTTTTKKKIDYGNDGVIHEGENMKLTPLLVLSQFDLVLVADKEAVNDPNSDSDEFLTKHDHGPYLKSLAVLQLLTGLSFADMVMESPSSSILSSSSSSSSSSSTSSSTISSFSRFSDEANDQMTKLANYVLLDKLFPQLKPYLMKVNSLDMEMYLIASLALDIHSRHINQRSVSSSSSSVSSSGDGGPDGEHGRSSSGKWIPEIESVYGDVVGSFEGDKNKDSFKCSNSDSYKEALHSSIPLFNTVLDVLRECYYPSRVRPTQTTTSVAPETLQPPHKTLLPPFFTYTQSDLRNALNS